LGGGFQKNILNTSAGHNMEHSFNKSFFTISIILFIGVFTSQINAQEKVQIFGLAGYQVNTNITVAQGELKFKDAPAYGAGIDIRVDKITMAEFSWSMSGSILSLDQYLGENTVITDLNVHHFQAGAIVEPEKGKVSPFGLITMGATLFSPTENNYSDEWKFSFSLGLGAKVYMSDRIGLRFQGRVIIPVQFTSGSIWVGSGGTGVAVGAYTTFTEFDFLGGLFIRI
jgi:hypothetical protein